MSTRPRCAPGVETMLIVQLSDLHIRKPGEPSNRVAETNMLAERALRAAARRFPEADALILTGDIVDRGSPEEYAEAARLLSRWAPRGFHAIPGNHDARDAFVAALKSPRSAHGF